MGFRKPGYHLNKVFNSEAPPKSLEHLCLLSVDFVKRQSGTELCVFSHLGLFLPFSVPVSSTQEMLENRNAIHPWALCEYLIEIMFVKLLARCFLG